MAVLSLAQRKEVYNMYLTVTREEVENLIRKTYNLPDEVKVYIYDRNPIYKNILSSTYGTGIESNKDVIYQDKDSISEIEVTVNKENQVQAIVQKEKAKPSRRLSPEELSEIYERYAQTIEDFLKGKDNEMLLPLEGMSPSCIRYRYNTAIRMYGFDGQCFASATDHAGKGWAKLVRKGQINVLLHDERK